MALVDPSPAPVGRTPSPVRVAVRDGVIVRVKICPGCGKEKFCREGSDSDFGIKNRYPNGKARTWLRLCRPCFNKDRKARIKTTPEEREQINARRRARHAERMATDPDYRNRKRELGTASTRKWLEKPENRERHREAVKQYHRRRRAADPAGETELTRMYYWMRKERDGKIRERGTPIIDKHRPPWVELEPFRQWLDAYMAERPELTRAALAEELMMSERRLISYLGREYAKARLDNVDRALLNARTEVLVNGRLIVTLEDLYPL